jgi:plasmid stabilization system protein ParE
MKLRFLDVAEAEQAEAAAYYELQRSGLGSEFVEELDRTAGRILEFPNAWSLSSRNTRACQMKRFPYSIIYRDYGDEIVVVALQHHSRDPRRWEERDSELF